MMTKQEALEAKVKLIGQGKMIQELAQNESFKFLIEELNKEVSNAKEAVIASTSFEDLLEKRGYYKGLLSLELLITQIINRGKSQERTIKK